ncbi:hypothetical protein GZ77_14845 [Endozoicomonas montiporae]|uniref:Uncharacterized protein n=2 Tax=Endozoicomonas montiporae TaxID=1027273 RepID=A0A081N570_9GAMM|nr:hypothetical protein [Endozoicomonas montiporae]AMO57526.1 hypothetical protein EZMO1_3545 [Endozoicomonas montiporae CL-33]KEQ13593.1 hypothetical protein GZ77_14845 [Endozoicomonas montiporae]
MKTVSMTVRVTPEKKALHLSRELAKIEQKLSKLKEQFPSRQDCEQVTADQSKTCRDRQGEHCPRCQKTEVLAEKWKQAKAKRYNILRKIRLLGSQH